MARVFGILLSDEESNLMPKPAIVPLVVVTVLLATLLVGCSDEPTPTPTIVPTSSLIPTFTPSQPAPEPDPTVTNTPQPSPTPTPVPSPTATATPDRPGKFSEFNGAGATTWRRMHEGGQIVACYEGLALPRDSFCLSEGFRFASDYSEILDAKFLVAHLPDRDALVVQGNTTSRAGGDIRLGWITFENRVITHLDFNESQASTPVATATPRPTATPTPAQSASDRAVLIALYHSTGGANWDDNTNWLSDRPIGEWHGVTTDSNGRVIKLNLPENHLTGEIPPELGGLSKLTGLWLLRNQLTGGIPPELGGLSNLAKLYLFSNQLTGEIPPELGGLSKLTELFLDDNQLTGEIPPELSRLSNLTVGLGLSDNQLTGGIPPELGRLSDLTGLFLANNQLTGCILEGLRDIAENDLADLNLPNCGAATPTPTPTPISTATPMPLPNLVVDLPTVSLSSLMAGQSFTLNVIVRNRGGGSSGPTAVSYHRSTDSTITSADTRVGSDRVLQA